MSVEAAQNLLALRYENNDKWLTSLSQLNKVIRVFIRAVCLPVDSLARGEIKGSLAWRQPDF